MDEKKTSKSDALRNQKKEVLKQSLKDNLAIIKIACKDADITRETFYAWKRKDRQFKKEVEEIIVLQADEVEDMLLIAIKKGSIPAIMFYLKNKHAAYHPRQTIGFDHEEGDRKLDKIAATLK